MGKIGHIILNGDKKVMFSAPHAVEQTRDGKIKYAEQDTGEIARFVNKSIGETSFSAAFCFSLSQYHFLIY